MVLFSIHFLLSLYLSNMVWICGKKLLQIQLHDKLVGGCRVQGGGLKKHFGARIVFPDICLYFFWYLFIFANLIFSFILLYFDSLLWLLKEMIHLNLWVFDWMEIIISIAVMWWEIFLSVNIFGIYYCRSYVELKDTDKICATNLEA